ncbi:hypothetical protein D3C72_2262970 [compost metagenome]
MVFQTEPGANCVRPTTSWQVLTLSAFTYWKMVRSLAVSLLPISSLLASLWRIRVVLWLAWAGALSR